MLGILVMGREVGAGGNRGFRLAVSTASETTWELVFFFAEAVFESLCGACTCRLANESFVVLF